MRAFAGKGQLSPVVIKFCAPLNELFDSLRTLLDQNLDGFDVAQAVTGTESVLEMKAHFVLITHSRGDATLRQLRG